jgi:hypothetical protein
MPGPGNADVDSECGEDRNSQLCGICPDQQNGDSKC